MKVEFRLLINLLVKKNSLKRSISSVFITFDNLYKKAIGTHQAQDLCNCKKITPLTSSSVKGTF